MIVKITEKAKKQTKKLPKVVLLAIGKKIDEIRNNAANLQIKKLQGREDVYRVRVGSYRIVYHSSEEEITIVAIQHRKDVYKGDNL